MAKLKPTEDTRSHRQKFIDAATEHSADLDRGAVEAFRKYVRQIARTPADNPKKGSRKA